jgi:hypothetical protein
LLLPKTFNHQTARSQLGYILYLPGTSFNCFFYDKWRRDDDLSELTDAEICKELEPQGIINVKRFISRKTGQEVKLNTFLITFNTPNIPTSIHIGLYNVKVNPYIPTPAFTLLQMSEIWTIFLFKMLVTFLLQKPKLLMKYFILIFSYIIKILSNNIL